MPQPDVAPNGATALLDQEHAAWRPFEALDALDDAQLGVPVAAAHDWSGRDLIAHLVGWLGDAIEVANELAVGESSPARDHSRQAFAARGDDINAEIQASWRALPIAEVRQRMRDVRERLRAAVRSVPSDRWTSDPENARFIHIYTVEHYAEHLDDLASILAAARS